jgi:hypothetical protein
MIQTLDAANKGDHVRMKKHYKHLDTKWSSFIAAEVRRLKRPAEKKEKINAAK